MPQQVKMSDLRVESPAQCDRQGSATGTLVTVCTATFLMLFNVAAPQVAVTAIVADLGGSFEDVQWVVNAYALTLAALLLTAGALADAYGRRRLFLIGIAGFTVASLLCGLAGTPLLLNLARGVQGTGAAIIFATSLALLADAFSGRARGRALGFWGAAMGAGVALGPLGGGALIAVAGWEWIMLVNVPAGVLVGALAVRALRESRDPHAGRVDVVGVVTFSVALLLLVLALVRGNAEGWGSPFIVGCLAGGATLLALFAAAERAQRRPMLDLTLFRKPTFAGSAIAGFAVSASIVAGVFYVTLYLLNVGGHSPVVVGLQLIPFAGLVLVVSAVSGHVHHRVPVRLLLAGGFALAGAGLLLMHGLRADSHWSVLLPGLVVGGTGLGIINPALATTAIGVVSPARSGMASGINNTFRQVGIAVGIAGLGAIFEARLSARIAELIAGLPGLADGTAARVARLAAAGRQDAIAAAVAPGARDRVLAAAQGAFADGIDDVLLIAAALALVTAVLMLVLVRERDFVGPAAAVAPGGDDRRT
jgi:EmrB/QacA subfamily drug resistance transporter